ANASQGHRHVRSDRVHPHAIDVAAPAGDAAADCRRGDWRGQGRRFHRAPARTRPEGRQPNAGSEAVRRVPAEDHAGLRRGDQHHHGRRRHHEHRGKAAAGPAACAGGGVTEHGLDELRPVPHAGALQGTAPPVGAHLPRRQRRPRVQEHLQGHRVHPDLVRAQ
ncbi:MAG: hypothetical protein AF1210, partial [uncultured Ramlibacter sp.]